MKMKMMMKKEEQLLNQQKMKDVLTNGVQPWMLVQWSGCEHGCPEMTWCQDKTRSKTSLVVQRLREVGLRQLRGQNLNARRVQRRQRCHQKGRKRKHGRRPRGGASLRGACLSVSASCPAREVIWRVAGGPPPPPPRCTRWRISRSVAAR